MGMAAAEWKFHVLAVDDSLVDRKLIERLLQKSSCQVTTVDSGYKALEFLGLRQGIESNDPTALSPSPQEVEVNLIITDYCMPGMTAAEWKFHVLAVDDSLVDRKLIERLLQKSSCQVTTVDSGYKALEFLGLRQGIESNDPTALSPSPQEVEVNLIITDYCMPGMTGYDLLKKLKESAAFKSIPVVIMSSENVPARISRCLEEGAEEFFLKPVRLADLNNLKPHMMKTKLKNQKLEEIEKPSNGTAAVEPEIKNPTEMEIKILPLPSELEPKQVHLQEVQVQQEELALSNNKRKTMEDGLSTARPRPRLEGIATAV
ncbi:hypothetical protein DY000_02056462 [Brassica cretica]|uniref:Response regulatory domain-containing protein n=1 Tax=Brassica cretica TaxID=69181 RepID=A0ABQ7AIJ1_BRACR|nr:hypothetical protein DY000_02056462 [Brassica cretica]